MHVRLGGSIMTCIISVRKDDHGVAKPTCTTKCRLCAALCTILLMSMHSLILLVYDCTSAVHANDCLQYVQLLRTHAILCKPHLVHAFFVAVWIYSCCISAKVALQFCWLLTCAFLVLCWTACKQFYLLLRCLLYKCIWTRTNRIELC